MLKISATLLNSWNYIYQCHEEYQEQAYEQFIDYLSRKKAPPTEAMQRGIEFEALAYEGKIPIISNIIKNGQYQVYAEKVYEINKEEFKLVGYLDVLKEGIIYDIKRNTKYEFGKYEESYQQWCYLALIPEAKRFIYLVGSGYSRAPYDEKVKIHTKESYENDGTADLRVIEAINHFTNWLKSRNLYDLYIKNFTIKEK